MYIWVFASICAKHMKDTSESERDKNGMGIPRITFYLILFFGPYKVLHIHNKKKKRFYNFDMSMIYNKF